MNSYKFTLKQQDGEKCYHVPRAIIENKYGLPEKDAYIFFTCRRDSGQVIYLNKHSKFKKRIDSRLAI